MIFHDPNDVYNRLFNRPVITIDKNDDKNIALLKDETEKELGVRLKIEIIFLNKLGIDSKNRNCSSSS